MNRKNLFLGIVLFLSFSSEVLASDTTIVRSPDGNITFKLFLQKKQLYFSIALSNKTIIAPSPMGLTVDKYEVTKDVTLKKSERYTQKETYPVFGAHAKAVNWFNGVKVYTTCGNSSFNSNLEIRVFNDGVGFRHQVISEMSALTPQENTVFNLPSKSTIWYHDLYMHYEGVHVKKQIDSVQSGEWVAPPTTIRLPKGVYASITEAALLHYPGMALQANGKNGLTITLANDQPNSYPYKLRYSPEDTLRMRQPAKIMGTLTTPWRVVIIGKDLNALVNNDIITNLNPPPDPKLFPN